MSKERTKTTFLGDLIFIIILVIAIYLAMNISENNQFKKIELINDKYQVNANNLIPVNQEEYIVELSNLNNTKYTAPIIDYIKLNNESIQLNKLVNWVALSDNNCVSKTLQLKVNVLTQKQDSLINTFESLNAKKVKNIYWETYLSNLKNANDYKDMKIEILKKRIC